MKTTIRSLLFLSKVKADCQRYVGGAQGSFLNTSLTNSDGEEETLTLYKTGDFAKIVDGRLYYEGRLDAQVSLWIFPPCLCSYHLERHLESDYI